MNLPDLCREAALVLENIRVSGDSERLRIRPMLVSIKIHAMERTFRHESYSLMRPADNPHAGKPAGGQNRLMPFGRTAARPDWLQEGTFCPGGAADALSVRML